MRKNFAVCARTFAKMIPPDNYRLSTKYKSNFEGGSSVRIILAEMHRSRSAPERNNRSCRNGLHGAVAMPARMPEQGIDHNQSEHAGRETCEKQRAHDRGLTKKMLRHDTGLPARSDKK